jgi:hypothetical protein
MYAIPPGTTDNWIAYGYFNYYPTVYNDNWATRVSAQMHEIGHNLYLQHSNEGGASYADQQGMMGYSYNQDDGPVMCFNAAKNSQLTWYRDREVSVNQPWRGKVIGLADYGSASSEQSVIVKISGDSDNPLYVTYNRKAGVNSGTREAADKVTVVQGADRATSDLLAKLDGGESYNLRNFWGPGNDLTVTVEEIATDFNDVQYAMVNIEGSEETPVYELTINSGSGDGNYAAGQTVSISADAAPAGHEFDRWLVDSGNVQIADENLASTTLEMPDSAATVSATYRSQAPVQYSLTVNSGTGDGDYEEGAVISISANAAPAGQLFNRWVVNAGSALISNAGVASTTLVMPANDAVISATYSDAPVATYTLTVNGGDGDGSYQGGTVVDIVAETAPAGKEFDQWIASSGAALITDVSSPSTTLIMPFNAATVTASYEDIPIETHRLTVNGGSGDGNYPAGTVTSITADPAAPGEAFNRWVVDAGTAVIADPTEASTTLTMGEGTATVTAEYRQVVIDQPIAEQGIVNGVSSSSWTTVNLDNSYTSMVVVATPNYSEGTLPAVARIRRASGSSFQLKLSVAAAGSVEDVAVHYLVVEEGVYDSPRMEARTLLSDGTNHRGSWGSDSMEEYNYAQVYTKPVVLGQVMSHRDPGFSVFWASKGRRKGAPNARACYVGKHIAEDTDRNREKEKLGVIVIDEGSGELGGIPYTAGVGPRTIEGMGNEPPYAYPVTAPSGSATAILASSGMKGKNGGWPVLYGDDAVTAHSINIAVDEDAIKDLERRHGPEKFAYIVLGR